MQYWLMKSEPSGYSIDDLAALPAKTDSWEGVRNYQARNFMRDDMKKGDLAFFYHSSCSLPAIVGVVKIVKEAYADETAFNPESKYFDAKSDYSKPRWVMVDVKLVAKWSQPVTLKQLRAEPRLKDMWVLRKGSRLSITPVTATQWSAVLALAGRDG